MVVKQQQKKNNAFQIPNRITPFSISPYCLFRIKQSGCEPSLLISHMVFFLFFQPELCLFVGVQFKKRIFVFFMKPKKQRYQKTHPIPCSVNATGSNLNLKMPPYSKNKKNYQVECSASILHIQT